MPPGRSMGQCGLEVLDLAPGQLGAKAAGIFVVDDEGAGILAGPFASGREALRWIERTAHQRAEEARLLAQQRLMQSQIRGV